MTPETIPAIPFDVEFHPRGGSKLISAFVGVIPARILKDKRIIPVYNDVLSKEGYQRKLNPKRAKDLAESLRKCKTELPTAVLLNIRDKTVDEIYEKNRLNLSKVNKIYIVDGQHRIAALVNLIEQEEEEEKVKRIFWNYKIPFVCFVGANRVDEMRQFHMVNTYAKSIPANLRNVHMVEIAEEYPNFAEDQTDNNKKSTIEAEKLLRLLIKTPLWQERIKTAESNAKHTTINAASMNKVLQRFIKDRYLEKKKNEERVVIFNIYWESIKKILPEAFESPLNYAIQKGVGVRVLTDIFPSVLQAVQEKAKKVDDLTVDDFVCVLKDPLLELSDENRNGDVVGGHEFWLAKSSGVVGQYSSEAGYKALSQKIKDSL